MQNILPRSIRRFMSYSSGFSSGNWFLLLCFLFSSSAIAKTDDIKQPLHIDADSVTFNRAKGYAIYQGNVSIKQGTLSITAAKIEIFSSNNTISRMVASGSPVRFQQQMDDGKRAKGRANNMRYLVQEKQLRLSGGAKLTQDKDTFSSDYINYAVNTGELSAGGGKNTKKKQTGRVKAVFYPSNK